MNDMDKFHVELSEAELVALKSGSELSVQRGDTEIEIRLNCEDGSHSYEHNSGSLGQNSVVETVSCEYCGDVKYKSEREE